MMNGKVQSLPLLCPRCTILLPFQMIRLVAMALLAVTQLSGSLPRCPEQSDTCSDTIHRTRNLLSRCPGGSVLY
ncbi:hypothetical protein B0H11DRAFT_2058331 [Mycena galericulata]|nr:hypothetical protein B0H11DRAFT_2102966 [Mycena galericulata]KAJ7460411.1 hypothetical protein B0H11DRAFT_2058331 [Mycena galericulata]